MFRFLIIFDMHVCLLLLCTHLLLSLSEWKTEHYSDLAMIYGSCEGVVSADAPTYLGKIAKLLHNSSEKCFFLELSPKVKRCSFICTWILFKLQLLTVRKLLTGSLRAMMKLVNYSGHF